MINWTVRLKNKFQFTPLREGRHVNDATATKGYLFQFTPLREGRQFFGQTFRRTGQKISIHAPA